MWHSTLRIILTPSCSLLLLLFILLPHLSYAAITLEVDGSTASPVTVYNGVSATLEAENSACPSANYYYEVWFFKSGGGGNCSRSGSSTIISETNPPATSCSSNSTMNYTFTSNGLKTLCYGYKTCNNTSTCTQPRLNQLNETGVILISVGNAPAGIAYFIIEHDSYGINCVAETITVTAYNTGGAILTNFTGAIMLDTQTTTGSWSLATGSGVFNDATANDGLATYSFDTADNGVASFNLDYQEGIATFDIDTYLTADSTIRDDDSEGDITFSSSGFTVTANPLSNPPPDPINEPILAQTAGTAFPVYITAYGQTPTDPTCGVIEGYTDNKNIKFWSNYNNPTAANAAGIQVAVDGNAIATVEAGSVSQIVTFTNGQASITTKYKDVGNITINMKDDTVPDPNLPDGIRGATNAFVVKPAEFILSDIVRNSDNFANPAAADASGLAFITAADNFSVTVTVKDSEGDTTLSYGKEDSPETIALASNLVAPIGGNNPAIVFTNGFAAFSNGVSTGTDFSWAEVGIITLTPSIGDADYLGAGNIAGATSENVGRFHPDHFDTTVIQTCNTFTYSGQPFSVTATAKNNAATPATTQNYTGTFSYDTTLSNGAVNPIINFNGTNIIPATSFLNGTGNKSDVVYTFPVKETVPYTITLRANDADTGSAVGVIEGTTEIRSGRARLENIFGSELTSLTMPLNIEYYSDNTLIADTSDDGFILNTDDSCTTYDATLGALTNYTGNLSTGETTVTGAGTIAAGIANITFSAPDTGNEGSVNLLLNNTSLVNQTPNWLTYNWNVDCDNADADDDISTGIDAGTCGPFGTASFGLYRGDDRIIYWREVF